MAITLAPDRKTASVDAEYLEKLPYYDPDRIPGSPFDFREVQILATRDRSVIGIEGGDLRFLSTDSDTVQALVDRKSIPELAVD
jgi:hypothetical protein